MRNPHQPVEDLGTAWQILSQRWQVVKTLWHDKNREHLERTYLEPLARQAHTTQDKAARLAEILVKARKNVP